MKIFSTITFGATVACGVCPLSWGQQATGAAAAPTAVSPTPAASPTTNPAAGASASPNPSAGANSNNSPGNPLAGPPPVINPAPNAAGNQPLYGAQPGQTGSMESRRVNALNQAYELQQRRDVSQNPSRLGEHPTSDVNQLAPTSSRGQLPIGTPPPVNQSVSLDASRRSAINGLQQLGYTADDWRVVNQSGRWWFWAPNNSWMYFNNGTWIDYQTSRSDRTALNARRAVSFPPGYATEQWRLVFHEGRWWFWTPNETWMYLRDGQWNDYPAGGRVAGPGSAGTQYSAGYRGASAESQKAVVSDTTEDRVLNSHSSQSIQTAPAPATTPAKTQNETGMNVNAPN